MTMMVQKDPRGSDPNKGATDRDHVRYTYLLSQMGSTIPRTRQTSDPQNVRWFLRQGAILVSDSWYLDEAVTLAQRILNQQE